MKNLVQSLGLDREMAETARHLEFQGTFQPLGVWNLIV